MGSYVGYRLTTVPWLMQVSTSGINLIKKWEGCHDLSRNPGMVTAYLCTANFPTIGFGSTRYEDGRPVHYAPPGEHQPADTISVEEAEGLLLHEIKAACEPAINQLVSARLTQSQYDALTSFIFNVGVTAFANSTLLRLLNTGLPWCWRRVSSLDLWWRQGLAGLGQ